MASTSSTGLGERHAQVRHSKGLRKRTLTWLGVARKKLECADGTFHVLLTQDEDDAALHVPLLQGEIGSAPSEPSGLPPGAQAGDIEQGLGQGSEADASNKSDEDAGAQVRVMTMAVDDDGECMHLKIGWQLGNNNGLHQHMNCPAAVVLAASVTAVL